MAQPKERPKGIPAIGRGCALAESRYVRKGASGGARPYGEDRLRCQVSVRTMRNHVGRKRALLASSQPVWKVFIGDTRQDGARCDMAS